MWTFNHLKAYLRQRVRQGLSGLAKQALAQPRLAAITQKLVIDRKYQLNIGHPERVVILLVGCGGTGGFVAHILAQLACWAKTANIDMRLYFFDPDIVEQRNLVRQNFCPTELGAPKAVTLAWRFSGRSRRRCWSRMSTRRSMSSSVCSRRRIDRSRRLRCLVMPAASSITTLCSSGRALRISPIWPWLTSTC